MFQGFICEPFVIRIQSYCNQGILYQKQAKKKMIMLNSRPSLQSPPWCVDLPSTGPKLRWHKPSTHPASRLIAKWTWSPLVHFLLRVISHNSPICGWIWLTPLWIMFFLYFLWLNPANALVCTSAGCLLSRVGAHGGASAGSHSTPSLQPPWPWAPTASLRASREGARSPRRRCSAAATRRTRRKPWHEENREAQNFVQMGLSSNRSNPQITQVPRPSLDHPRPF